jgi:hypothetical protein
VDINQLSIYLKTHTLFGLISTAQFDEAREAGIGNRYVGKYLMNSHSAKLRIIYSSICKDISFNKLRKITLIEYNHLPDSTNIGLVQISSKGFRKNYEYQYKQSGFKTTINYLDKEKKVASGTTTLVFKIKELSNVSLESYIAKITRKENDIILKTDCKRLGKRWKIEVDYLKTSPFNNAL